MDSILNVEKEIDRVISHFTSLNDHSQKTLNDLVIQLQSLQRDLTMLTTNTCELSGIQAVIMNQNIKKIRDIISQISMEHKDLHGCVSKVGKAVDKNFVADFACLTNDKFLDSQEKMNLANQVIVEHFLRQGRLDIADELIREAAMDLPADSKTPFTELNEILDSLKSKDLKPALEWAKRNRSKLEERNSLLEFKLHRMQYIELMSRGMVAQQQLIEYARENFQHLAEKHEKEIQALMGSLVYLRCDLSQSPYAHFLDQLNWTEICEVFTRDACALLGLSIESPLFVTFNAGCRALPALLNIRQVMQQRQVTGVWTTKDELPIVIDLGRQCQFHSIFACPILRQQSTENNPPMRLVCGHVISRDALNKLANGTKLKCPYCPVEQSPLEAKQIWF